MFGATVFKAIAAAGGVDKKPYPPSGIITIRSPRKSDGRYYQRRRFNFRHIGMKSIGVRDGDLIVVQYKLLGL
jgi:hypothetical protein